MVSDPNRLLYGNVTSNLDFDVSDPDAPSREKHHFREVLHWLVVNIPGSDVSSGDTLMEYIGSGPPQGTGTYPNDVMIA